jgi:PPOX class probable F420-dependent enzyme
MHGTRPSGNRKGEDVERNEAVEFVNENIRAVLATRRSNGDPQLSPITISVDGEARVVFSTTEDRTKTKNLRRDPRASLSVLKEAFFGGSIQIDGGAEIVSLPEAMELLVDYYRSIRGEHPDWDDYRAAMQREGRCLVRIDIERAVRT